MSGRIRNRAFFGEVDPVRRQKMRPDKEEPRPCLGGNPALQDKVALYAAIWSIANLETPSMGDGGLKTWPQDKTWPGSEERQMDSKSPAFAAAPVQTKVEGVAVSILAAISISHLLNDLIQSLLPAIYPILKANYHLDFGQIGLLTLTFQCTASLLQAMIGG